MLSNITTLADLEETQNLLAELEKLAQRKWLDGNGKRELDTILKLKLGQLLYRQQKYQEALQTYLELENQLQSEMTQIRKDLAAAFYSLSKEFIWPEGSAYAVYSSEGEVATRRAIIHNSSEGAYYYNLGVVLHQLDSYDEAISAFRKATELASNGAPAFTGLGNVLSEQNRLDEAIAAYNQAIALNTEDATAYYNLSIALKAQQKLEQAIAACHKAIELNPKDAYAYNSLGWTYLLKDDLLLAAENFESSIEADNELNTPVFNLGLVYALQGRVNEAKEQWQMGLALCQDKDDWDKSVRALYTIALGHPQQGMTELQILIQAGLSVVALQNVLGDAEVLARCPNPPEGIEQVVEMLQAAIQDRQ
jgi:tetratricopeptide (TPR) repeat protein